MQQDSISPNEANHDLLALRYVGDEMPPAERADFESLLAESQAAREAVATAVVLFAAVPLAAVPLAAVPSAAVPSAGELRPAAAFAGSQAARRWMHGAAATAIGAAALGAAACLVAIFGIHSAWHVASPIARPSTGNGPDQAAQATSDLALQWTSLSADSDALATEPNPDALDTSQPSADDPAADETAAADTAAADMSSAGDSNEASDELAAPSWLLAAVSPPAAVPLPASAPILQHSPAAE